MIKRITIVLVLALLTTIVLIALIADSPLMDEATELLLARVTERKVEVGSARLTFIPGFKLAVKELTIKEPAGAGNLISIQNLYLQGSILKLLRKDIYIKKLELIRCHLNLIDRRGAGAITDLFHVLKGKRETEESTSKPFQWTVSLEEASLANGSISYVKGKRTDARVHHTIENINAMVTIAQGDITIEILDCTYKSASGSLAGTIKDCFTKDPEFFLQVKAAAPLSLFHKILPFHLAKPLFESRGELSLVANGYFSYLTLETTMEISPSLKVAYLPLTILLKGYLKQLDQLELQKLEITSPCGNVRFEGMIANLFSDRRWFKIGWRSNLESRCFRHLYGNEVEMLGIIPCSGKIEGEGKDFITSVDVDFSSLSFSSPYLVDEPKAGIQSIAAQLSKKEDTFELSTVRVDFHKSYLELDGLLSNAFAYPKTFQVKARGNVLLPEVALLFPILEKKKSIVQGETSLYLAVAGNYLRGEILEIKEGIIKVFGSEARLGGTIAHAFSKACNFALNTRVDLEIEEILNHCTITTNKDWKLINLPPLSLTLSGPLDILRIKADSNLEGFEMTFPQMRIYTPPAGGSLQLEATVERRRKVSLHNLALNFGGSQLNAHGSISQRAPNVFPLEIEATGILRTDELITFFSKELLGGFSTAGALSLKSIFRGDSSSFTLTTDADLTETFWEIPPLIGKARGLTNRTTFTLRKDEGVTIAVENCEWILESAKGIFSLKHLNEGSGRWFLKIKTSPLDLSSLQSLRWHRKNRFPTGEIEIDLEMLFTPSDILKSSLGGFIELRNISFPFNGNDYFINTRLRAQGDHLEIPPFTIKYKNSDFTLQGNVFWEDKIHVESELTSDFIDLKDFMPISREQFSHQEKLSKNEQGQLLDTVCEILRHQPILNIKADIGNLQIGNQNIRDWKVKLNGGEGNYDIHHTFTTAEGESTIQAQISPTLGQSFKQSYYFDIHGFNISDVAQQLQWENVPITGKVNLYGKLEHSTMQGESFFNPKSVNGQLKITFSHGEIRKLALLRNILLLINLPTVTTFAPVLREIFIFNQVLQLAKTKGRIINLRTIPYESLEGNFIIKDGVAVTEDLVLISDVLTLAASGSINLQNQTLEGQITARPFGSLRSLLSKVPMVGKKVTDIQDKLLSTYFTIEGDVGKPEMKAVPLQSVKEGTRKIFDRLTERIMP